MRISPGAVKRTVQAYEAYREAYTQEWDKRRYRLPPLLQTWMEGLNPRSLLLDLGCGVGQDSRYLRRNKYRVIAVDGTWSFLQIAHKRSTRLPLVQADLHDLPFTEQTFDGMWAAASLIHCRKARLQSVLRRLRLLLRPGGLLGATLRHGSQSGYLKNQWIPGRYISQWRKPELQRVIQQAGWTSVRLETVTNQERKGRWLNVIARRDG